MAIPIEKVFHVPGNIYIEDSARPDATGVYRSRCRGHTIEEMRVKAPGVLLRSWDEAMPEIKAAERAVYARPPKGITAEQFDEMLNVLPPMKWERRGASESFMICEATTGSLRSIFCRVGDKFYEMCDETRLTHDEILARVAAARKE